MKCMVQAGLAGMVIATTVLLATAQQTLMPVVRLSNFVEVGNDVFMHFLASSDIRYKTVHNYDFDNSTRDRTPDRNPSSTGSQEGESDLMYAELRFGVEAKHQKNLLFNDKLGNTSHLGINTSYSNPGVLTFPIGVRVFPRKGHEIMGWFVHRRVVSSGYWIGPLWWGSTRGSTAISGRPCTTNSGGGLAVDPQSLL